ncbi:MAG: ATP-binding protein [Desulfohalobiaceae bacterium]|nr:ATP-binding protein [Desulfohalobiaceae bacterium]
MIPRQLHAVLEQKMFRGKAILVTGPRQSGKTTLLRAIEGEAEHKVLYLNCDEPDIRGLLTGATSSALKHLIGNAKIIMIDEAQRVKNIGLTMKLIIDTFPNIQLLATGSSALEFADEINEPLTGRKWEYRLLPMSTHELAGYHGWLEERRLLEQRLVYGMYPDVVINPGEEREILSNLTSSYLYKDIFTFQQIRKPEIIEKLLEALALQITAEVSYNELAQMIQVDSATVQRYLNLLEKSFVLFRLRSFSRNVRNELKRSRKVYFYDNGIRNALIANFSPPQTRVDIGALWENFLVSERTKQLYANHKQAAQFFWRTKQQQEIDYLEEADGILSAFEFKWNPGRKARFSKTFLKAYPNHTTQVITPSNYMDFLVQDENR